MSYRRDSKKELRWKQFLETTRELVIATGLSRVHTGTPERFMDLLMHGYLDHHEDISNFTVCQLTPPQYEAFKELVARYFQRGYPYFTVIALRTPEDQRSMEQRFGDG